MLRLQIGFPSGRYCAASVDDPRQPEWPPHPSRVFSALVAAAYAGAHDPTPTERRLLNLLGAASPPSLTYPDADTQAAADSYVPVNDQKSRLSAKTSAGVLLPNRQVRQFPSAFMLGEPEVTLTWPLNIDDEDLRVLDRLAARVTHVGTSHSFVTACFLNGEGPPASSAPWSKQLVPAAHGEHFLRVTLAGRLDELDRLAGQGHGTLRRPSPLCETMAAYAQAEAAQRPVVTSAYDWVSWRLSDASWGADTAHTLARAVRRAVLSHAGDDAPPAVHGHDDTVAHLAWLPLPDVGHAHARGRIRGVAVGIPLCLSVDDSHRALVALSKVETLKLPDGQVARLIPSVDVPQTPAVLRASTWTRASTHWSTVTPVLLDRPPKRQDPQRVLDALADSVVMAGFPRPIDVVAMQTSDFEGAPGALDIPTNVPRFHARIVFAEPVAGPVIAGRWRNFGIGLFRPTPKEFLA